jgi:hypothetical protein
MAEYTKEQLLKIYEKLPPELQDAVFSEETANNIFDICSKNEIEGSKMSEIAKYVGRVLMGLLPPEEFQATLELELNLDSKTAKNVARDINAFIFIPLKPFLAKLYNKVSEGEEKTEEEKFLGEEEMEKQKLEERKKEDTYREPIE